MAQWLELPQISRSVVQILTDAHDCCVLQNQNQNQNVLIVIVQLHNEI